MTDSTVDLKQMRRLIREGHVPPDSDYSDVLAALREGRRKAAPPPKPVRKKRAKKAAASSPPTKATKEPAAGQPI